jgi:hypothetical protein
LVKIVPAKQLSNTKRMVLAGALAGDARAAETGAIKS